MDDSYAKLGMEEADTIISKLNPKIIIPEHGDVTAGAELAKHLNVTEEVETSGNIIITREILDSSDSIRVINLDHLN
jgi:ribulose-5-phosphate 4-epimerase/fuculose-1-phosphate aldolase